MTKYQEMSLRPQGAPWPGLNTRGGRLDPGSGQLEDGSINAIINEGDILQKRKGMVRGLEERFSGVVCGLFRYTDDCGIEYLLVADEDGINIRTPFTVPIFTVSDAYPSDDFEEALDPTQWNEVANYTTSGGSLLLTGSGPLTWFKEATNLDYEVQIQYLFDGAGQGVQVEMKKASSSFGIIGSLTYNGTNQTLTLLANNSILDSIDLDVGLTGFMKVSFSRPVSGKNTATVTLTPSGGAIQTLTSDLNEVQAVSLGQTSALQITDAAQILSVIGGPV